VVDQPGVPSVRRPRPPRSERDLRVLRALAQRIDAADAGAHNNLGVLYFNKGMHDDAISAFQRAVAIDGRMELARRNLEIAFVATGYYERLIASLRESVRQNPDDIASRRRLA
jgi:cellulose synthase operon protein C